MVGRVIQEIFLSFVVPALVGWFSAQLSFKDEIKKSIYEEREKIYIELFDILYELQENAGRIYDHNFISNYKLIRSKANLYASNDVLEIIKTFNSKLEIVWKKYTDLYADDKIEIEIDRRIAESEYNENGVLSRDQIEYEINRHRDLFIEENIITNDEIGKLIDQLASQMRNELKTSKKI